MRLLGFGARAHSSGAIRMIRRRADELQLDHSHFRGKRRWSDQDLKLAIAESRSWRQVIDRLGLSTSSGHMQPHLKSHAIRLGLETEHLNPVSHSGRQPSEAVPLFATSAADRRQLRTAAPLTAAAWFTMRSCVVSFPAEPALYDLLADSPEGLMRVQVKTTTNKHKNEGWMVGVGHHPDTHSKKGHILAYSPDEIDLFFIVDGDMTMYLIPSRAIAGRVRILLRTYAKYMVGSAAGLLAGATAVTDAAG